MSALRPNNADGVGTKKFEDYSVEETRHHITQVCTVEGEHARLGQVVDMAALNTALTMAKKLDDKDMIDKANSTIAYAKSAKPASGSA